jgi:hypothetical protein
LTSLPAHTLRGALALLVAMIAAAPLALLGSRGYAAGAQLIAGQAAPLFDALARAARRRGPHGGCLPD